jgi:hypothetical protein
VVIRRIVGVRNGRPLYSDALGELVSVDETNLTVATKNGTIVVPLSEVHRAKRVPPQRRPTAADVVALELAADAAWPAPTHAKLGDWLLRSADGWTGRANSALPIGDPDRPLEAAIDAIEAWYAERGQPALVNRSRRPWLDRAAAHAAADRSPGAARHRRRAGRVAGQSARRRLAGDRRGPEE